MLGSIPINEVYSVVFLIFAAIYSLTAIYVLTLNIGDVLNKTYFFVNVSLAVWAFSYSLISSATSYEEAFLWNRISVLGWGIMYSLLFHHFLILTEKTIALKQKVTYLLIYLPATVNIVAFGISGSLAAKEFILIQANAGWVNISENSFFDYYFYGYYIIFSLASLLCLWTWKKSFINRNARITRIIISIAFFLGVFLGSLTDVFFRLSAQGQRPQVGVLFAILPISSVFYAIIMHGIMSKRKESIPITLGYLFSETSHRSYYRFLSKLFMFASVVQFVLFYFVLEQEITSVIKFSGFVFTISVLILLLSYSTVRIETQDTILGILLSITIPIVYFHFNQYGQNLSTWTVPFFFIILSIVFSTKRAMVLIVITAILHRVYVLFTSEPVNGIVGEVDYFQRLLIYIISSILIYYVSRIYKNRLDDHERMTNLQHVVTQISYDFVSVDYSNFKDKVESLLSTCGIYFKGEQTYLYKVSDNSSDACLEYEWCADSIVSLNENYSTINENEFQWTLKQLKNNEIVNLSNINTLPVQAQSEKDLFLSLEVKSAILLPLMNQNNVIGFFGIHTSDKKNMLCIDCEDALSIIANILSDALVKVDAEKTILDMAYYDALTGLSNRAYFTIQIDKMIALASRKDKLIGVLFLDLDDFKTINDTKGHDVGDNLLIIVSERITSIVRKSDVVCRFGGDEFLIMLPLMDDLDQIKETTQKVMSIFEEPIIVNDQSFYITASCGVSVYPADGYDSKTLIKSADLAMYASKASGKNRYSFCTPVMMHAVKEKMELTNDLYRALERNEFALYYQPQVNTESLSVVGLEALIRWNHPTRGMVSPFEFIALAEQTGLIHAIGEWVIKTACLQNKAWQDGGFTPVVMAVNLSVEQFRDTKLIEIVSSALKESGLDPKYLELEITESIAIKEPAYIIDVLNQLKALGVSISIDDFGTAYSSLSRIKELPIDRLKIAMEFVQGIGNGTKDEDIAIVIINLAKRLNLKVIAEGVEMESQLTFLRNQHCDEVQGYYFYRPMTANHTENILQVDGVYDYTS